MIIVVDGRHFITLSLLLLTAAGLKAQTGGQPGLPGEVPWLQPRPEIQASRSNWLVTGFKISNDFDDNALNDKRDKQFDMISGIESRVGWAVSHPRLDWKLDYHLGLSLHEQDGVNTAQSHLFDTDLQLNLTKRMKARLRNSFLESSDLFDRLRRNGPADGSVLDRPNSSILAPDARRRSEQAGLDLTYATGPHSYAGISGAFFMVNYSAVAAPQPVQFFADASSIAGHAVYSRHLSPRYWAGLEYNVQKLLAYNGQSQSLVQSAFFTQTFSFAPQMAFSIFAGPEHSANSPISSPVGLPVGNSGPHLAWSWAGGGIYHWTPPGSSLTVSAYRKISDGGGLLGIVRLNGVSTDFHRELASRWTAALQASYDDNRLFMDGAGVLSTFSIVGGLGCRLNRGLMFDIRYWRGHVLANSALANAPADHNRVSVSMTYEFKGPLER